MTSPSEQLSLRDGSVLVTGATGGIGRAIVELLSKRGTTVFAAGRSKAALEALVESTSGHVIPLQYDVTDEKSVKEAFRSIQKQQLEPNVGMLVGLVNNAGEMKEAPLLASNMDLLKHQLNVNFLSAYQHMQLASRLMARSRHGAIVNVVSQIGEQGNAGLSAYAASKAALTGATKSLAKELAPIGIRVNAVAPGFIETELTAHYDDAQRERIFSRIALKKAGSAELVAQAIVFLLDDASNYTTGHVLPVDGLFQP
ncbi:SDR family NAD(P)-dependent oxidoreductase [Alteromonas sp. KUL49]|uniref:SDR family NAD(P)-dependent oxidoreductase n=1 Tax=Alteromonas sp. KUL49 TaxID=2480798 RepID=UPI00102F0017|nr:SDR family NAD(P)-dependent oxidoreductase [Alteromonas sp. KUL49]TAP39675.1 SDR family oxidoreductase [Alteromonas sp. KUL49]GEA11661.1 3-oxoacyl-[acyl-carrier-protein] reductase FabG [Alteromonas sp. KUL49]